MKDIITTRENGKTYVALKCPGCMCSKQLLLSHSDSTLRLYCMGCNHHWDQDGVLMARIAERSNL